MSKVSVKRRQFNIKRKKKRKEKIKKLKKKCLEVNSEGEKKKILQKIQKIAPHYPVGDVLKLDKGKNKKD